MTSCLTSHELLSPSHVTSEALTRVSAAKHRNADNIVSVQANVIVDCAISLKRTRWVLISLP